MVATEVIDALVTNRLRRGLSRLTHEAKQRFGKPFNEVPPEDRDALLGEFQQRKGKDGIFFNRLLASTLEGAFGHPVHGGNRKAAGWKLIGYQPDPCAPFTPTR